MAAESNKIFYVIISVLALVVVVFAIMAFTKPKAQAPIIMPAQWPAGCNPKNPGYDMNGNLSDVCVKIYCALNPNDPSLCNVSGDCFNGCSSSRPGYDCFGKRSANC